VAEIIENKESIIICGLESTKNTDKKQLDKQDLNRLCEIVFVFKLIISKSYETISSLTYKNKDSEKSNEKINDQDYIKLKEQEFYENNKQKKLLLKTIFIEIESTLKIFLQSTNNNLVETTTQLLKFFMRGMKSEFTENYLSEFLAIVVKCYSIQPFCTYLYYFEIVLSVVPNNSEEKQYILLKSVLEELCKITFEFYLNTPYNYENNPTLTEDIFGLLYRGIKKNPLVILDSSYFENLLVISINNIDLKHPGSAMSIINLLENILNFQENKIIKRLGKDIYNFYFSKIYEIILKHGGTLVYKIFSYIQVAPVEIILDHLINLSTDIIYQMKQTSVEWYVEMLKLLPESCLTNTEKQKTLNSIDMMVKCVCNDENPYDYEDIYRNYCRLIYSRSIALIRNNS